MGIHLVNGDRILACLQDGRLADGSLPRLGQYCRESQCCDLEDEGMSDAASAPIRISVSACLLGEKVRYGGGHKRDPYLMDTGDFRYVAFW